ncbi:hypothetical protein DVH24_004982 [Malus domestica]|uniref:Uncharacterized protein n=1 Tax=Malus domestica TaxID=3750 RepID=A0A498IBC7_MALDO|nr:hypothetical protein DVH24_004982 [Malus domestica]
MALDLHNPPNWTKFRRPSIRKRESSCSPSRRATPSSALSTSRSKSCRGLPATALSDQSLTESSAGAELCNMS